MNENRNRGPHPKPTKLTPKVLNALPCGARVRDAGTGAAVGLFAERGQRGNVRLKIQADLRRPGERARTVRIDLGRWPDEIDLDAARDRAREHVRAIKAGRDPRLPSPAAGAVWTVSEAFSAYAADLRKARGAGAERSAADLLARRDLYLATWLDRPLSEVTALDCRELHDRIIELVRSRARSANHTGERTANMVLKDLRGVFKLAGTVFPGLGAMNPAAGVRLAAERREHGLIELADYPAWKRKVDALDSPVRRCLHRVALFSGLRSSNVRAMRRVWVDLDAPGGAVVRFPAAVMKNREAFSLPVSKALGKLLEEALRVGRDARPESAWMFPAPSKSGHVEVTRERGWPSGWYSHGLRHSYSNAAKLAGVDGDTRQLLLAQRVAGVRGTYLSAEQQWERLREAQEKVSRKLLALLAGRG